MRLCFIFLTLVILTIGWKKCVQANRTNSSGNSLHTMSSNHKNSTNSGHGFTNQIGWRNNVTSYRSPATRNSTTLSGSRRHNSTSTTFTKISAPSRNSYQIHNPRNNNTRATASNRNSTLPNRNSTNLNYGHTNTTKVTLSNRSAAPPSRNSTLINHGRANSTRVSPSNRSSTPTIRNNITVPPPVVIYVPITTRKPTKKETSLTETFLDALQKELSKPKTTTTTRKPKTTAKPITKTEHKIVRRPPNTTKAPIATIPLTPYPPTPISPFRNTSSFVQSQSPQVLYLPGGPYGYYVCNKPGTQMAQFFYSDANRNTGNPIYPRGIAFAPTYNGSTGSYVQPAIPAPQQGHGNVQSNPFYNTQNFGNGQLGTQQDIGQPGAIPQGPSGPYIQPGQTPQSFVNGQPANTGFYAQPGLVTTSQRSGYVQYPATLNPQNIGNVQAGMYGSHVAYPQGFSGIPQGSYTQASQTPLDLNNGQHGTTASSTHSSSTNEIQQPREYNTQQYYGNVSQPGLVTTSQGPGYAQYPENANHQNIGNGQLGTYGSYFGHPQGFSQTQPGSYMQTSLTPQGFSNGQSGSLVSTVHSESTNATQEPGKIQPQTYTTPQHYGNNQPVNTGFFSQQGPGYIPYPANTNQQNIGNSQSGTYGSYAGHPQGLSQHGGMPQDLPGSYSQTSQISQGFSNGQPGNPDPYVHYGVANATQEPGAFQPSGYTNPHNYGNGQSVANGSYVANQPGFGQHGLLGSNGQHFQTENFSSNIQPTPTTYPQHFGPGLPPLPVTNIYPGLVNVNQQGHVNNLPIAPGSPQPYIYGPQGQICTFVYNQPGVLQQPYPTSSWQGFPNTQSGSYGVYPTGANNLSPSQYQSYPVWPNLAYPNVQPNTFYTSQGINSSTRTNTTSSEVPGTNY